MDTYDVAIVKDRSSFGIYQNIDTQDLRVDECSAIDTVVAYVNALVFGTEQILLNHEADLGWQIKKQKWLGKT